VIDEATVAFESIDLESLMADNFVGDIGRERFCIWLACAMDED